MKTVIGFVCGTISTFMMGCTLIIGMMLGVEMEQKKQKEINFKKTE